MKFGHMISARLLLTIALTLSVVTGASAAESSREAGPRITVYKNPACGCCKGWVDYLSTRGFQVETHEVDNLDSIKAEYGLTDPRLMSCHTAIVDGYVVEGHVPANDILRLLSERPDIIGITAPGMPPMSPGMGSVEPKGYQVLSFDAEGGIEIYSRY